MTFEPTKLAGVFVIRLERREDERGFFARTYCARELRQAGLDPEIVQSSVSYNRVRGTLRGLHYQAEPYEENKIVSCIRGAVHDVVVDIRRDSPTYKEWLGVELSADAGTALYVPKGFAHGFLTLEDDAMVTYDISTYYEPSSVRGIRYDDPAIGVAWPTKPTVVSAQDLARPSFE
ncbi:MAG TPA: dTDP-4-dehydrorhamnose 3,5-epimerase [Polyangia bacterium]|nr:dTDP-4-dehydrorhamnose 3,5-epimerase [Polyangia bacterium]